MVFTGIVQCVGKASLSEDSILTVRASKKFWEDVKKGDSVAVGGCCLTALATPTQNEAIFFVSDVTQSIAGFGRVVNLEKSLKYGDRIGGHMITGHVDGRARVVERIDNADGSRCIWVEVGTLLHYLNANGGNVEVRLKGSIAVNGVSLTIAEVRGNPGPLVCVKLMIIPHTLRHTNLMNLVGGYLVNIEFDRERKASEEVVPRKRDEECMLEAIVCGENGRTTSAPNPWVGCVIHNFDLGLEESCIGRGFHARCGEAHAEVQAIEDAKSSGNERFLKGATLYCTLEPCAHNGRTGKCVELIKSVGIRRVVVAVEDPDPKVNGKGIQFLRDNGIDVTVGVLRSQAAHSLRSYLHHRRTGRPWVVWKVAASLDGRMVATDGKSQHITSEESRRDAHERFRATSGAIITGSGTARADNPELSVRHWPPGSEAKHRRQPIRVITTNKPVEALQRGSRVLNEIDGEKARVWVATVANAEVPKWMHEDDRIKVVVCRNAPNSPHPDFVDLLSKLSNEGVIQVLLECGPKMGSDLFAVDLIDQLVLYKAPVVLGDRAAHWMPQTPYPTLDSAFSKGSWALDGVQQFGGDVCLEYVKDPKLAKDKPSAP